MSNQTVFYILGIALVVAALIVSAVGLRMPTFPPNRGVLAAVVAAFAILVGSTATFAVLNAQDEQAKSEAEAAAETTSTTASSSTTESSTATSETTTSANGTAGTKSKTSSTPASGGTVKISADPSGNLAFEQKSVSTKAGDVTIDFTNQSPVGHDVKVQDSSGQVLGGTDLVTGDTTSATVPLDKGTYTFFCDVPGHEEAGMKGTLTVK
jgi:plastocyanin